MITALAFVGLAGLTALVRLVLSTPLNRPDAIPWGTLAVNLTGTAALAALAGASTTVVTVAGAGGLGAYTTFSKFAVEVDVLARDRGVAPAAGYVALSVGGCTAVAWVVSAIVG